MAQGKRVPFKGSGRKVKTYRLRLEYRFDRHECRRELVVPVNATLEDLHTMIQACGNLLNYHLYNFKASYKGKLRTFEPTWQIEQLEPYDQELPSISSNTTKLKDVFANTVHALYSYDYGDGWEIDVTLLYEGEAPANSLPYCANGRGDCPPEDVGGEGGFSRFLAAISDFEHPEHESMSQWGEMQHFEHFDVDACNERLSRWEDFQTILDDDEPGA